jgi:hypothetical protein
MRDGAKLAVDIFETMGWTVYDASAVAARSVAGV